LSDTAPGASIDTPGQTCTAAAIVTGGTNLVVGTPLIHDATGTIAFVTTVAAGVATAISLVANSGRAITIPTNPVTFRVSSTAPGNTAAPTAPTLNLTWTASTTINIGATNATTVNIGRAGQTVNINGNIGTALPYLPLVGGTVTGATTFSGSGTALTVNNNTLLKGTLTAQSTLTLGLAGSTGQTITGVGTGNFLFTLGGASSIYNFRASDGTSLLQMGATISARKPIVLTGPYTITGLPSSDAAIFMNNTWTGSSSGGVINYQFLLQSIENVNVQGSGGGFIPFAVKATGSGASLSGNRQAGLFWYVLNSTPLDDGSSGFAFNALNLKVDIMVPSGGTDATMIGSKGATWAFNPVAHIGPLAVNWRSIVGNETNVWNETGSSVMDRIGEQIVLISGSTGVVTRDNVALSLNNQSGTIQGWEIGFGIGRVGGECPISPTGYIMRAVRRLNDTIGPTIYAGIDFTQYNFVGPTFASNGFSVAGSDGTITVGTTTIKPNGSIDATPTLNIGTGATTTVNIGKAGGTTNILGTLNLPAGISIPYLPLTGGTVTGNVTINGALNATSIGATTPGLGTFTTATVNTLLTLGSNTVAPTVNYNGPVGSNRYIRWQTAGLSRWQLYANSTAEGGGNAGTDFVLASYDDAGNSIGNALLISRANRNVAFYGGISFSGGLASATNDLTKHILLTTNYGFNITSARMNIVNGGITWFVTGSTGVDYANITSSGAQFGVDTSAAQTLILNNNGAAKNIAFRTAGLNRWNLQTGTTETGTGDVGSDLSLQRYNDTGTSLGTAFTITRATGLFTHFFGISFSNIAAAGTNIDNTRHIILHTTLGNGINNTGTRINYVAGTTSISHNFLVNAIDKLTIATAAISATVPIQTTAGLGVFGTTAPAAKPTISGSRGSALATIVNDLLNALSNMGILTNATTA